MFNFKNSILEALQKFLIFISTHISVKKPVYRFFNMFINIKKLKKRQLQFNTSYSGQADQNISL